MARGAGDVLVDIVLRPQVPMGAFQALGYVCALGAAEGLQDGGIAFAGIGWPSEVADSRTYRPLLTLRMRAGYDKGMYASCEVRGAEQVGLLRMWSDEELRLALEQGIMRRVEAWEQQVMAGAGAAGPLAPILGELFDALVLMNETVEILYPNGRVMARGTLAGIDVWGRATVRTEDGQELEIAPEQASIRKA